MINRVILVGRLTKDPELRYTSSNIAVTTFTIAVNRNFKSSDEVDVDFIQCVAWRKTAENTSKYVHKGSLVGVDGRIQVRNYEAKDGTKRYITEVVCDSVAFLESKNQSQEQQTQTFTKADEQKYIKGNLTDLPF